MAPSFVVSPAWLADHLNDSEVAIADCRFALNDPHLGRQHYQVEHIPGAYYLDLNQDLASAVEQHGGRHPLPEPEQFAKTMATLGLDSEANSPKWVIAYDDSRMAYAARLWWLLRYFGYERVAILDGGFSGWQKAGLPTTSAIPEPQNGRFIPRPRLDWVVGIDTVKQRKEQPNVVLIDSREGDRYRGEREPIDPVAGHIPGAVNYPWLDVTDDTGRSRPASEHQQRWKEVAHAEDIMVYCGSGVTACVNLLSLEMAGIQGAKLYAGSWSDWCSYL